MTDDPALDVCAAFVAREESFRPRPYLDPAGVPTIGFGQTYLDDGARVAMSTPPITLTQGAAWLRSKLAEVYLPAVRRAVHVALSVNQAAALGSLCYNIGPGNFRAAGLVYCVNTGRVAEVPSAFAVWDKARDPETHVLTVSKGLVARRAREAALYVTPDGHAPLVPSQTPAISAAPEPAHQDADDLDALYNPTLKLG